MGLSLMSIHNLKDYKQSKIVLPHLIAILKVLDLTERSLKPFNYYVPVARVLVVIKEQKSIIESYKEENETIKKSKGKKNEN